MDHWSKHKECCTHVEPEVEIEVEDDYPGDPIPDPSIATGDPEEMTAEILNPFQNLDILSEMLGFKVHAAKNHEDMSRILAQLMKELPQ